MKKTPNGSLLVFPCDFTIKVFGLASDEVKNAAIAIIQEKLPRFDPKTILPHYSKQGKYQALSITVTVESQLQLDAIYQALSSSPHILMVL